MKQSRSRLLLGFLWLSLSISLGVWWTVMGLTQANQVAELKSYLGAREESVATLERQSRMIKMEGGFFMFLLIVGGSTLIFLSQKDLERTQMLKDFFATLTHEMKTPLASLRLQAESLEEDLKSKKTKAILSRLIDDSKRLELQMDKALYLAALTRKEILYLEVVNLSELISQITSYYPFVSINTIQTSSVKLDVRAFESVIKNIIENAKNHGKATKVTFKIEKISNQAKITISDNGIGFQGNTNELGKLFFRHSTHSGSGIGLYLVKNLIRKMNGHVHFRNNEKGFEVTLHLPVVKN
ncbi:MAG TPA: HAMP domain-containing sensor histidine kinase [Leptospiraceae bacterium]|nr:HAMP domain-containing sensor histidine kinase [Leptospiraceae bacterium]HMX33251.1 HAMP domain-containing sensor histidine kinase [Leptospiraceae bacterium]HMY32852.1 HAMP domain-containing sensor histidine kinase [Leptospiraceae bacterium]HMZ66097.1 HAMP domain-containing sensor histidine kinase [Leptospiraceae bacterium]HNA07029.1 HAMP domain-containing sensor histidine kinase [Leptospiraceae bacterium]